MKPILLLDGQRGLGLGIFLLSLIPSLVQAKICRVHAVGYLLGNTTDITGDAVTYECNVMTADGETEEYIRIESFKNTDLRETALWKGEWFIEFQEKWLVIHPFGEPPELVLPENHSIKTLTQNEVWDLLAPSHARRRSLKQGKWKRRLGERSVTNQNRGEIILVRARTADEEPRVNVGEIYDSFFGINSFQTQMKACSFGHMDLSPYDVEQPVLEVSVPLNTAAYTFSGIFGAAEILVREYYGVGSSHELAEFVVVIVPMSLSGNGGRNIVAAAGYDSWKSVFTDEWAGRPMVSLHEIGHNLNIGHSWKGGNAYGDRSSVMGSVSLNVVHNCYNGIAYDHLGWVSDKVVEIDHTKEGPHSIDLAFYGEYDIAFPRLAVVVKVAGYYMYYNLKRGINADTMADPDRVLLHRYRLDGAVAAGSIYSAFLHGDTRPRYLDQSLDLSIRVCRTAQGGPNDDVSLPSFVTLEVGTVAQSDSLCHVEMGSPTQAPAAEPTVNPSPRHSPSPSSVSAQMPTLDPTQQPVVTEASEGPSFHPTMRQVIGPSAQPSRLRIPRPSTPNPTHISTSEPTHIQAPTQDRPTTLPSPNPTRKRTMDPSLQPVSEASVGPSLHPTHKPTLGLSAQPSRLLASRTSTPNPTHISTRETSLPSPSTGPTQAYTTPLPSSSATDALIIDPTLQPTQKGVLESTLHPTRMRNPGTSAQPSQDSVPVLFSPTQIPASDPMLYPTERPTVDSTPSPTPSHRESPTTAPSLQSSSQPMLAQTNHPTQRTTAPSNLEKGSFVEPTAVPEINPEPTLQPSKTTESDSGKKKKEKKGIGSKKGKRQ